MDNSIENIPDGFIQHVNKDPVDRIENRYDIEKPALGTSTVIFTDGRPPVVIKSHVDIENKMLGTPVSNDGSKLFVGRWRSLYAAYDCFTGKRLWTIREGRILKTIVYDDFVILEKAHTSVIKADINDGAILNRINSGYIENVFKLDEKHLLINDIGRYTVVIDVDTFEKVRKYDNETVNPGIFLSFLMLDAELKDNQLVISGFESVPWSDDIATRRVTKYVPKKYTRVIDPEFYK
jgi:hypothetical protein